MTRIKKEYSMNLINDIIYGILIGIANIIPGVSGGAIAMSMGIYDDILYAITHVFSNFKKSIQILFPYILGALFGIISLSFIMEYLFSHFPFPTYLCFIGLILGGIPNIKEHAKIEKFTLYPILICMLSFSIIITLQLLNINENTIVTLNLTFFQIIKLFFIGIISSSAMIVPGVSGSMILMMLGYYTPLLRHINYITKAIFTFNASSFIPSFLVLLPFGIGIILGIFIIAKIVEILLKYFPTYTYSAILGIILASPISIIMNMSLHNLILPTLLIGILTLYLSIFITQSIKRT